MGIRVSAHSITSASKQNHIAQNIVPGPAALSVLVLYVPVSSTSVQGTQDILIEASYFIFISCCSSLRQLSVACIHASV